MRKLFFSNCSIMSPMALRRTASGFTMVKVRSRVFINSVVGRRLGFVGSTWYSLGCPAERSEAPVHFDFLRQDRQAFRGFAKQCSGHAFAFTPIVAATVSPISAGELHTRIPAASR